MQYHYLNSFASFAIFFFCRLLDHLYIIGHQLKALKWSKNFEAVCSILPNRTHTCTLLPNVIQLSRLISFKRTWPETVFASSALLQEHLVDAYLARLQLSRCEPTLESLQSLLAAHVDRDLVEGAEICRVFRWGCQA